jgi:ketol-acid reductoisomerase
LVLEAASDHGPTALFGGLSRTLDVDREEMAGRFRRVLEDITSGAFARRFQEEAERGYPMLEVARALMNGPGDDRRRGAAPADRQDGRSVGEGRLSWQ